MYVLFVSLTFLIAHVFFFSAYDFSWFILKLDGFGISYFWRRYIVPAVVVGLIFYFCELPGRLKKPVSGRGFMTVGLVMYVLYLCGMYGGITKYRPGLGMLLLPLQYFAPIAMVCFLIGAGKALLNAEPKARSGGK